MARVPISEEEALSVAEQLQERFLKEYAGSEEVDSRDLQRVRTDTGFVAKYARQQGGNLDNAFNQLVESLKWRKDFGVNDIHFEDVDDHYWRSGMAYTHGMDKKGNRIIVLNIRLHRKDSKKALAMQRWITFSFEAHSRLFPKHQMCMIFDMTGSGLAQMDMGLMRFIVNCFKIYFPNILALLLVYNMPWILQAAWKIVQSWLAEGAVAKVKFVNSESITEYISSEQLLVNLGGTDEWEYDYETEKALMLGDIQRNGLMGVGGAGEGLEGVLDSVTTQSSEVHSSDVEQSPSGGSVEVGAGSEGVRQRGENGAEDGRKVRFSANLPPTRQSRFGPEEEEEEEEEDEDGEGCEEGKRVHSPDNQQLLRGSAASHGFRRRQVHKLMSLQTDSKDQRSPGTHDGGSRDDGSPRGHRVSEPILLPFSHIRLSPANELVFTGQRDTELLCTLSVSNTSQNAAAFKIKTTAPRRYKVRPNLALVDTKSVTKVQVLLVPGTSSSSISEDKFLVQMYSFPASVTVPTPNQLLSFWRALSDKDIREHRMRCRWVKEATPSLLPSSPAVTSTPMSTPTPHNLTLPSSPPTTSHVDTHSQRELRILGGKLDRLLKANEKLSSTVHRLQHWNYVLLLLLAVLLLATLLL